MPNNVKSPVVQAVKKVLPAMVSITMTKNMQLAMPMATPFGLRAVPVPKKRKVKLGGGSGFIIDKKGIILTNRHVLEDNRAQYRIVLQDGKEFQPEVLAKDPINDIAVLKIKANNLPAVEMGDSLKIELGQEVIAIGNALGLFNNTVSTGVISGLSREIKAQSELSLEQTKLRGLIQTDAAINPGNSGGPLIDLDGKAIGINAAMVFGAENIGFALPINNAKKALEELKKYGRIRQPFLGLRYLPITQELKEQFDLPFDCGALVMAEPVAPYGAAQAVVPQSPAHRAGLREADIILELNNKKIAPELSISDILQECQIGQSIPLKLWRAGRTKIVKITLTEKKF